MAKADIKRLAAGSHPNLRNTLFLPTVRPDIPPAVEAFLCAALDELSALGDQVSDLESRVERLDEPAPAPVRLVVGHTQLLCRPEGYAVLELDTPPPAVDDVVVADGAAFDVLRLVPSPFPGDPRRCAVLVPRF
jgi:hypothetical protein